MNNKFLEVAIKCHRRLPQIGDVYTHFKGMKMLIIALGIHTETNEPMIVYRHDDDVWIRPLEMFLSKVDKTKYPDVKQTYRLERELPLDIKQTSEFKEYIMDLKQNDNFKNMDNQELEDYILRHYYL